MPAGESSGAARMTTTPATDDMCESPTEVTEVTVVASPLLGKLGA
jgi:hypothetical protein